MRIAQVVVLDQIIPGDFISGGRIDDIAMTPVHVDGREFIGTAGVDRRNEYIGRQYFRDEHGGVGEIQPCPRRQRQHQCRENHQQNQDTFAFHVFHSGYHGV